MKKRLLALLLTVLTVCNLLIPSAAAVDTPDTAEPENIMKTYYVSPDGDDSNNGTSPETAFATLEKARDTVRTINNNMTGDIVVYLMDGTWELEDTLSFGEEDSGTNGHNIWYKAYGDATPTISGGTKLEGSWTQTTLENGKTAYTIPLNRDVKLRALYVNGERRYMAKTDAWIQPYAAWPTIQEGFDEGNTDWAWRGSNNAAASGVTLYDAYYYYEDTFPNGFDENTRNQRDIEIENQTTWNKNIVCVDHIEAGSGNNVRQNLGFYFQQPYGYIAQTPGWNSGFSFSTWSTYVFHNAYEFLDQPGEFYFDRDAQKLYYIPMEGEDMSDAEVIVPRLETVVEFRGDPQVTGEMDKVGADNKTITGQVENIIFDGITVAHSDWNLQKIGESYGKTTVQAGTVITAFASCNWHTDMYRNLDILPGAVEMEFAHNICFQNGSVQLTGAEGIVMSNDVDGCQVVGNFIYETGGSGVLVGHPQHIYENDSLEPETYYYKHVSGDGKPYAVADGAAATREKYQGGTERAPRDVLISNNFLLENCRLFPSHSPITSYFTERMEVSNNFIKDAGYHGMSIGWGWCNFDGTTAESNPWDDVNAQGYAIIPNIPTTVCKDNKIINNRIDTAMTILHDGGLIYTLGDQPSTELTGNFGTGSQNHGLYADEGSANFETIRDNVVSDIGTNPLYCVVYGRKHDLTWDENYVDAPRNANRVGIYPTDNRTYPDDKLVLEDYYYIADSMWPKAASDIIQNSGLTAEYRAKFSEYLVEEYGSIQDALLPESARLYNGETLTLNAWLDAADEIWLAPAGTTEFAVGETMTKAAGNAASIDIPSQTGTYYLYAVIDGETTSASTNCIEVGSEVGIGTVEAEDCAFHGQLTKSYSDSAASNGAGVENLYYVGDSITIGKLSKPVNELTITYASKTSGTFGLYVNDQKIRDILIVPNGKWNGEYTTATVYFMPELQAGDVLSLKVNNTGECWNLDKFELSYNGNGEPELPDGELLHLSADTGVTTDETGAVSAWADADGTYTLTQSTADAQPTMVTESGVTSIRFDGNDDYLGTDTFENVTGDSEMTIILVGRQTVDQVPVDPNGDLSPAVSMPENASWGGVILTPKVGSVLARFGVGAKGSNGITTYYRPVEETQLSTTVAVKDGTTETIYVNGSSQVYQAGGRAETITNTAAQLYLAKGRNVGTYFKGDIAELLIYDRALTEAEILSASKYLQNKYLNVAAPTAHPVAGSYEGTQTVTLSCATPGADIYYTLDGTEPTTKSQKYTEPLQVDETATVKAIAARNGWNSSDVVDFTYTISEPTYTVTADTVTNGTLTVEPETAKAGDKVNITATPAEGYQLKEGSLKAYKTDDENASVAIENNAFTMPAYNVTVTAEFVVVDGGSTGGNSGSSTGTSTGGNTGTKQPADEEPLFADVDEDDWFAEAVEYVVSEGLMNGTSSDKFTPNGATTRGMIVTILYRQAASPAVESDGATWWSDARVWAMANGISDGTNMDGEITREQLATMLYRYAGSPAATGSLTDFADGGKVSSYAVEALKWAAAEGIVTGKTGGIIDPQAGATRAETATMFMRFCG